MHNESNQWSICAPPPPPSCCWFSALIALVDRVGAAIFKKLPQEGGLCHQLICVLSRSKDYVLNVTCGPNTQYLIFYKSVTPLSKLGIWPVAWRKVLNCPAPHWVLSLRSLRQHTLQVRRKALWLSNMSFPLAFSLRVCKSNFLDKLETAHLMLFILHPLRHNSWFVFSSTLELWSIFVNHGSPVQQTSLSFFLCDQLKFWTLLSYR